MRLKTIEKELIMKCYKELGYFYCHGEKDIGDVLCNLVKIGIMKVSYSKFRGLNLCRLTNIGIESQEEITQEIKSMFKKMMVFENWIGFDGPGSLTRNGDVPFSFSDLCYSIKLSGIKNDLPTSFDRHNLADYLGEWIEGYWRGSTNGEIKAKLNGLSPNIFESYRGKILEYLNRKPDGPKSKFSVENSKEFEKRVGIDKTIGRVIHSKHRAQERYSLFLNRKDLDDITNEIGGENSWFLRSRDNGSDSLWLILFKGEYLLTVYDDERSEVVTFLTMNTMWEKKIFDRFGIQVNESCVGVSAA